MPSLIVDSSAVASIVLGENPEIDAQWSALIVTGGALAPAHFPIELVNTLVMAVRRKRITELHRSRALIEIAKLAIEIEPPLDWTDLERTSKLAQTHKLSVYDAIYLDAAMQIGLPLATHDKALRSAAQGLGVGLLQ
ncbi:MAG: type II toxin-antitoxin system VapC family toxin [Alphaproteobacteria bacterium]